MTAINSCSSQHGERSGAEKIHSWYEQDESALRSYSCERVLTSRAGHVLGSLERRNRQRTWERCEIQRMIEWRYIVMMAVKVEIMDKAHRS